MSVVKVYENLARRKKDKEDDKIVFNLFKCSFCRKIINPYRISYILFTFGDNSKEYFHPNCYVNSQCNGIVYYDTEHKIMEPDTLNMNDIEDIDNNILCLELS